MARLTRLVIMIKNIYTLWGRKRFLLTVTYFPTNLVYHYTLRVTGKKKVEPYSRVPRLSDTRNSAKARQAVKRD